MQELAPLRTPAVIIQSLNRDLNDAMNPAAMKERLAADGAEPASPNGPARFRVIINREIVQWGKLLSGLKVTR